MKKITPLISIFALIAPVANAQNANLAYEIVEGLTTEVGQRLAGTEGEAKARAWGMEKLKSLGFSNVHIETYDMPTWVRGAETAEVVTPYNQKLMLTALGNSGATPVNGISAKVIDFKSLDALKAVPDEVVKGKIVYVTHNMQPTQNGASYGAYGAVRRVGPNIAAKKGAIGYIMRSLGTDNKRSPHTGVTRFEDGVLPIPSAALSIPDAENLDRMLKRSKGDLTIHLTLTPKQTGMQQSGNLIAEVQGTDPNAGIIVVAGHLDSWDLGTGAIDDAAGVAIVAAAAKNIMDMGKPKRTIRVIWMGSEEVGGFGQDAYDLAHKNEKFVLASESDFGADRVWAFAYKLPDSAKALGERLQKGFAQMGIIYDKGDAHGGSDIEHIIENGAAVIDLKQDGTHYFDLHHTPDDTLDKIDPAALQQNVDAWTLMLKEVANAPEDLTPVKVEKK